MSRFSPARAKSHPFPQGRFRRPFNALVRVKSLGDLFHGSVAQLVSATRSYREGRGRTSLLSPHFAGHSEIARTLLGKQVMVGAHPTTSSTLTSKTKTGLTLGRCGDGLPSACWPRSSSRPPGWKGFKSPGDLSGLWRNWIAALVRETSGRKTVRVRVPPSPLFLAPRLWRNGNRRRRHTPLDR